MKRQRSKVRVHLCHECGHEFTRPSDLTKHLEICERNMKSDISHSRKMDVTTSKKSNKEQPDSSKKPTKKLKQEQSKKNNDTEQPERMTQVTEQQEETRPWQQYELFQLTIKIEPLRMDLYQPEVEEHTQQSEQLPVKTELISDSEEEDQQNVSSSYNLRGSSKQTLSKVGVASSGKSHPKELQPRKSLTRFDKAPAVSKPSQPGKSLEHSEKVPTSTNIKELQPRKSLTRFDKEPAVSKPSQPKKSLEHSEKEPTSTNIKELQPRKSLTRFDKEPAVSKPSQPKKSLEHSEKVPTSTNIKQLQTRMSLRHSEKESEKESTSTNLNESQTRKSLGHSEKEPTSTSIKELQTRKSLGYSEKESTSTNIKESQTRKSLGHSEKEPTSTSIKELQTRKSLGYSEKESTSTNIKESQTRKSLGHSEKEPTSTSIKELQTRKSLGYSEKESTSTNIKESQTRKSLGHSEKEPTSTSIKELQTRKSLGYSEKESTSTNIKESQTRKSLGHSEKEPTSTSIKELQTRKSLGHYEKQSISTNINESQTRKSLGHSEKEPTSTSIKESQRRKSLRHSEKESTSTNIKESQEKTSLPCSAKESLVIILKETQPGESLGESDEETPLINLKESPGLSDEETPLINLKESPGLSDEETPLINLKESPGLSDEETPLINFTESQPRKSPRYLNEKSGRTREASIKQKLFTCSECNLEFTQRAELEQHRKWHEELIMNSISYACTQCGIQYRQLGRLKSHVASVHIAPAISQQNSRDKNSSYGDGSRQKSNEEIGRQNREQQRNAETVQQREESDDEMDPWSDAESVRAFEEDDRSVIKVGDEKRCEDVTTVCPPHDVGHVEENCQNTRKSQKPKVETTVSDSKAQTNPQVTQAPCELDSDLQQTRRSSRLSSDAYIHKILHGDGQQGRFNRIRQENPEAVVQDGQRKRQHEGQDVVGNVGKRSRQNEAVGGGFSQRSVQQNCPVIGQKNGRNNATGENGNQVGTGQSGQRNSTGRNDQLDVNRDIGLQSAEVENGQQDERNGEESGVGDPQKDALQGDELASRSSTLKGDQTPRVCRRTVNNVTRYYKEKVYTCSECGHEVTRPSHLARHKLRKHGKGPQKCNICGFQCETLHLVQLHMLTEHDLSLLAKNVRDDEQGQQIVRGNQQNSSGRNDQPDVGPQSAEVENGQQDERSGEESDVGDHQKDALQGDELDSRSSTLKGDHTGQFRRRIIDGVSCYYKETIYPCSECGLELTRPSHLAKHKLRKHGQGSQKCNICVFQCHTLNQLQRHMSVDHNLSVPAKNVRDDGQGQIITLSNQQNSSGRNDQLDANRDIGLQSAKVENGQQDERSGEESGVGDHQKDALQGDELDSRSSTLKGDHTGQFRRRTVDGIKRYYKETIYPCSECGLELTRPSHLARHKLRKHNQELKCNVCGFQCDTARQLGMHMRIDHDLSLPPKNVRDYEQNQAVASSLNEKLLVCPICGRKVSHLRNMQSHLLTHENSESTKSSFTEPYTCDVCGLVYLTAHTFRRHMLFHESKGQPISLRKREWFGKLEGGKIVIVDGEQYNRECNDLKTQDVESKDSQCGEDGMQNDGKAEQEAQHDGQSGLEKSGENSEEDDLKCGNEPADGEHVDGENGEHHREIKRETEIITPSVEELVNEITRREGVLVVCDTDVKLEDLVGKTPHTCSICGLRRNNPQQLERHLKMHAQETRKKGVFVCDQCGVAYRCAGFLDRHKLTHVVENLRVQCVEEPKVTSEDAVNGIPLSEIVTMSEDTQEMTLKEESTDDKSATEKVLIQYNTFYVCDECGTKFQQAKELLRHKLEHRRGNTPRPFVCQECGLRCSRRSHLEKHILIAHLKVQSDLCNICGKGFNSKAHLLEHIRTHTGERPFKCNVCGKGFTTRHANELHEFLHTGLKPHKCTVCSRAFATNSTLHQHMVTHTRERRFACTLCDKRFTAGCALKRHLRYHTGEKPFLCKICSKGFASNGNLQQHYVTHTKAKLFKCEECHKGFAAGSSLKTHMRLHKGVKPYTCNVCQKSFTSLGNLRHHDVFHSTERPFSCCQCGKLFKMAPSLKAHIVVVHSQLQTEQHVCRASEGGCVFLKYKNSMKAKIHVCTECGKPFYTPNKLRQHMVVHTREKLCLCTLCGVGFTCSGSLKCHMRIHNGVKPYTCEVCGKQFTQAGNYYQHKTVHTGEKPFKCNICFRNFRLRHMLKSHILRHIGMAPPDKRWRSKKKRPSKAQETSIECKEQCEKLIEEEGDNPSLYIAEPQYDSDDSSGSEGSDSEDSGGSDEQESSDDEDDSDHAEQE